MKKFILLLTVLTALTAMKTISGFAAEQPGQRMVPEIFLNNYFREQSIRQLEVILPRGKYLLSVNVALEELKQKRGSSASAPVRLPFSNSLITAAELNAVGDKADESVQQYLSIIKKIEIKVQVDPKVATPLRELIKTALNNGLSLSAARGDGVVIENLPEYFSTAWITASDAAAVSSVTNSKNILYIGGLIALTLLLGTVIITVVSQRLKSISLDAKALVSALKDSVDQSGFSNAPSYSAPRPESPVGAGSVMESGAANARASEFWDKVDLETLTVFCLDCADHPRYYAVPMMLVEQLLEPGRAAELEKQIPEGCVQKVSGSSAELPTVPEILDLFRTHQAEYRRSTRSPVSRQLVSVPSETLVSFAQGLEMVEAALLVNSLSPLRRTALLKIFSFELKVRMAAATAKKLTALEHKAFELSLTQKIESLPVTKKVESATHSLGFLSQIILKPESFAEDEAFYDYVTKAGTGEYSGVLRALKVLEAGDWAELNLQELAVAFAGYSGKIKTLLIGKFSGKRQEWMKNFLVKAESSAGDFHSPAVVLAQEMLRKRISEKMVAKPDARFSAA